MKTEVVNVTPAIAKQWLQMNRKNRPVRPSHVEKLRTSFERGEYVQTHQGVAFDVDGELVDGQHRLMAIALIEETAATFPMLVTHGLPREKAFMVVDTSQAIRTLSDVLGVDRRPAEVGMFLARIHMGSSRVTPAYAAPFVSLVTPTHDDLLAFCSTSAKTWSSGPVRAAAVISIMRGGDADYVKLIYRALVLTDLGSMPPIVMALFKSHIQGKVRAGNSYDIFARSLKAFDPKKANLSKVLINDATKDIAELREWLNSTFAALEKKRAPVTAPKSVSRRYFSLLGNAA
jgi:hypothetical protein